MLIVRYVQNIDCFTHEVGQKVVTERDPLGLLVGQAA